MKLIVLYRDDGRIVALSRVPEATRDAAGVRTPRSGVVAGPGQHVAIVELEPAWQDRSLAAIYERCTVVRDGDRVRLHERDRHAK